MKETTTLTNNLNLILNSLKIQTVVVMNKIDFHNIILNLPNDSDEYQIIETDSTNSCRNKNCSNKQYVNKTTERNLIHSSQSPKFDDLPKVYKNSMNDTCTLLQPAQYAKQHHQQKCYFTYRLTKMLSSRSRGCRAFSKPRSAVKINPRSLQCNRLINLHCYHVCSC